MLLCFLPSYLTVAVLFGIYVCWIPQISAECQSKKNQCKKKQSTKHCFVSILISSVHVADVFVYVYWITNLFETWSSNVEIFSFLFFYFVRFKLVLFQFVSFHCRVLFARISKAPKKKPRKKFNKIIYLISM